jgi:hypothetical protein
MTEARRPGVPTPPHRLVYAFRAFWWTLGVVVLVASVRTCLAALHRNAHGPAEIHLALLAGIEAIAALVFLVPRTMRIGGIALLVTFAFAISAHAAAGEFPGQVLLYTAATIFVLAHGPVSPGAHERAAPTKGHA